ncbi:MAG: ABC transporter ATP-binding protein, partial [Methanosarcinales archaeon]|nr:ABC transporter ATP-binding protein [Methanosarcinales archaeon]
MNLLEIVNLKTHFPTPDGIVRAVDRIDLSIREKETFGLVGETGCGKTVLGLTIMRLLSPTTTVGGEIIYKGKNLLEVSEAEMREIRGEEIAMILQNPTTSLNPVMRVGGQIAEAIRLHQGLNKKDAAKKAIEMLDAVRIPSPSQRANEYPHEFSGGMKQRVMIAMGLACNPSL